MTQINHGADTNEIKRKYNIENIVDYSSNVNIFSPSSINNILSQIKSNDLNYYSDINYTELRTKIASRYNSNNENIIVGNGSTEIMFLVMKLKYINKIGIVNPTFGEYERAAHLAGKDVIDIYYDKEFCIDMESIEKCIENIDMLVICNPNNPTGKLNSLEKIVDLCIKYNKYLMVDETFIEFTDLEKSYSAFNYLKAYDKIIIIRAVTKFYSLTNVRLGYAFSSKDIITDLWAIKEPWTVNIFAEKLADVIYDKDFIEKSRIYYRNEIIRFTDKLRAIKDIEVYDTVSNFILIKLINDKKSHEIKEYMVKRYGILIRDCSNFKSFNNEFIRINIKDEINNDRFIECFREAIYS